MTGVSEQAYKRSWPKTLVSLLLAPFAFLVAVAFLMAVFVIVGTWDSAVYAAYWLRWKITGAEIPRKP